MKNFLRVVMFVIIIVALVGTTIFLTNQNEKYTSDDLTEISSGENESINVEENIPQIDNNSEFDISGEISGEKVESGETIENQNNESGKNNEVSGDIENATVETIKSEISGETSGEVSGEIN